MTKESKTHLTGENLPFLEQLYEQYLDDPDSVDPSWEPIFDEYFGDDKRSNGARPHFKRRSIFSPAPSAGANGVAAETPEYVDRLNDTHIRTPGKSSGFAASVESLVRGYRLHGHTSSRINPLTQRAEELPPEINPSTYGFDPDDMDTPVLCKSLYNGDEVPLRQVIDRLDELYRDTITIEYQYMSQVAERQWLRTEVERHNYAPIEGREDQERILRGLIDSDAFETFLKRKYQTAKRFSLTGGDSLIPMLRSLLDTIGGLGVNQVLLGMAHRGRLNVLHNIMDKPAADMFSEFEKTKTPEKYIGSSDVKYHMGYSSDYATPNGEEIHLSLAFNPSHLEFVCPVVEGRTRAKQRRLHDDLLQARKHVMPLLLHGDAAFAGQGIVTETLNLASLDAYDVGGTVHIVINNQIGFTTLPEDGRSTRYSTDIAKMLEVPIFHVNGDDPEACVRAARLAAKYRQKFGRDVVIDLVCYRYYGHNEGDEPRFTQPLMYREIGDNKHVRESYGDRLVEQGVMTREEVDKMWDERMDAYAPIYDEIQDEPREKHVNTGEGLWSNYRGGKVSREDDPDTTYALDRLKELGEILAQVPENFEPHRTIKRLFKQRAEQAAGEQPLDWGFAEALAFSSLLDEGTSIRLTGQDSIRGTFSHRHAAITDSESGQLHWPARHISEDQGIFEVYNSSLSEAAVLGFEYGYSLDSPDWLTMWEAQFGDFVNGAQVIIDQFINSGEDKWKRLSGLTMLLPHGYEGQGPEHSSARLERFLQLCAEDNMFVCNLTTPAQYFHSLRRQMLHEARKPLIIMTPKSLLRLREATSTLEELAEGRFEHILDDGRASVEADAVERILLCSGKVYYDLLSYADEHDEDTTAIVRVEQLYPLEHGLLEEVVGRYSNATELKWVQEEPKNMGPWSFIFPELFELFGDTYKPEFVGRVASASPATGDPEAHSLEQRRLIQRAFGHEET